MWIPKTVEDKLISGYLKRHTGLVFLEVPIYLKNRHENARRIDAIVIPTVEFIIYERGTYSIGHLKSEVQDKEITIIEAKKNLNRPVIGQILIGKSFLWEMMNPSIIKRPRFSAGLSSDMNLLLG